MPAVNLTTVNLDKKAVPIWSTPYQMHPMKKPIIQLSQLDSNRRCLSLAAQAPPQLRITSVFPAAYTR